MTIFISYSHADQEIADRIGVDLVRNRSKVWIDRWELNVGDSLLRRIEASIQSADGLVVLLSKASTGSEWCRKEFTAGLLRELEEKRVVVLPAILDECEIPLFLRDKLYADFRKDFKSGMEQITSAIAKISSESQGRLAGGPTWHIDWSTDWGMLGDRFFMRITAVEHGDENPYVTLTEISISANEIATSIYKKYEKAGLDWIMRSNLIMALGKTGDQRSDMRLVLTDSHPKTMDLEIRDKSIGSRFAILISSRWLGEDTGRNVLLDVGGQLRNISQSYSRAVRDPSASELEQINAINSSLGIRH